MYIQKHTHMDGTHITANWKYHMIYIKLQLYKLAHLIPISKNIFMHLHTRLKPL